MHLHKVCFLHFISVCILPCYHATRWRKWKLIETEFGKIKLFICEELIYSVHTYKI